MSQKIFVFDAVGTVLHPIPDVATVYYEHGASFGSQLTREQIKVRFKTSRQALFFAQQEEVALKYPAGELVSNETRERELWYQLVKSVFADVPIEDLFDSLWNHFAEPSNWAVFKDVESCWNRLKSQGYQIAIASNFDARLNLVVQGHSVLKLADWCFCSADLGFRKPDKEFYAQVQTEIVGGASAKSSTHEWTMIGDDLQHDVLAPAAFGWNSIWLNRKNIPTKLDVHQLSSLDQLAQP